MRSSFEAAATAATAFPFFLANLVYNLDTLLSLAALMCA
jgi:hypothetical protein